MSQQLCALQKCIWKSLYVSSMRSELIILYNWMNNVMVLCRRLKCLRNAHKHKNVAHFARRHTLWHKEKCAFYRFSFRNSGSQVNKVSHSGQIFHIFLSSIQSEGNLLLFYSVAWLSWKKKLKKLALQRQSECNQTKCAYHSWGRWLNESMEAFILYNHNNQYHKDTNKFFSQYTCSYTLQWLRCELKMSR